MAVRPRASTRALGPKEPLIVGGKILEHLRPVDTQTANNTRFTLRTFVTNPGDQYGAAYKRVTVIATWKAGDVTRQRSISSFVTSTTRGLPLPLFKLAPVGSAATIVNPGANIVFGFELTNQGAPDKWDLTATGSTGWGIYQDDGDGTWELGVDQLVADTSGDGTPDTGLVDPTATFMFWAYRAGSSNSQTGIIDTRIQARSVMQPLVASAVAYVDTRAEVVDAVVTQTPTPSPSPTTGLAAPDGLAVSSQTTTAVTLTWTAVATATVYDVFRDGVLQGSPTTTTWTSPAWPSGTYSLQVRARTASATSAMSTPVSVTLAASVPVLTSSTATLGLPLDMAVEPAALTFSPVPTTGPADCPVAAPLSAVKGSALYNLNEYSLHNSSPGQPWPPTTASSTVSVMPQFSVDIASEGGRVIKPGGSLTESDTKKVVDWRANVDKKSYSGKARLRMWVAPLPSQTLSNVTLKAQLYSWKSSPGTLAAISGSAAALPDSGSLAYTCAGGWQEVQWLLDLPATSLKQNQYIGVRIWNTGGQDIRVAYDVRVLYPASLILPEK